MTLTKSYHNSFRQWWSVYTWSLKKQSGIGIIFDFVMPGIAFFAGNYIV